MKSIDIWNERYENGGHSGAGSRDHLLRFKVDFLNGFIEENNISSVLDFGHGDLAIANELNVSSYIGVDIVDPRLFQAWRETMRLVRCRFDEYDGPSADVVTCLDVFYHILPGEEDYLRASIDRMVEKTDRFMIVYAQDSRKSYGWSGHMNDTRWFQYLEKKPELRLDFEQEKPENGSEAKFFVYRKINP